MLDFIILSLAAYRITHLLVFDKVFEPIRSLFVTREFSGPLRATYTLQGGRMRRFIGKALICHWCTGIWASAAIVAGVWMSYGVVMWVCLALAAATFLSLIETAWMKFVGYPELVERKNI